MRSTLRIKAIDSHTGGEPTRVVVDGFPDLGRGTMADRLDKFRGDYDHLRSAIVNEPRGHAAIVGALLCEPVDEQSAAAVIFFNNVGYLGMCGHGTIGLIKTLEHMDRISAGRHTIETPAGVIEATLEPDRAVSITNVPSYRHGKDVPVDVPGYGTVTGDIAYGGNWFFLTEENPFEVGPEHLTELTDFAARVRAALAANGITGTGGAEIDHVEIFSPSKTADSRNFVLCPGFEYDRSPCGTGTSAKLACLYEDGKILEGQIWRQESIIGSVFEAKVLIDNGKIIPLIRGSAFVTAEVDLILNADDPFCFGLAQITR
ncbi:MAG TPA: proline racemase family protein [Pyrinomonadaceae bacterium]|nr:proline racemase family protein [Pyrinomonadaceae bacterium]